MPSREIFFNIDALGVAILYLLMIAPLALLGYGLARRVVRWRRGQPEKRFDRPWYRLVSALEATAFHGRIARRRNVFGGTMHALIFMGFITLLVGTLIVMVEADIAAPLGVPFLHGNFYLGFKLAMNAGGLALIAGVLMALYRRLIMRPPTQQTSADDLLVLAFLLVLPIQGYTVQGLRLAITHDPWASWSFVSYPLALMWQGLQTSTLVRLHEVNWYAHMLTAFAFIGYLAYSKMVHPFTAFANVLLRRLRPRGELKPIPNMETAESFGVSKLEQFSWAQLMSLDACMHCGRCLEYCPTFNTGKTLRPRDLILELAGLQADKGGIFSGVLGEGANTGRFRWGKGGERELIGGAVSIEEIWDCTTCGACMEQCPVFIEHVPFIVDMRRSLVMEQNSFPPELANVFTSLERFSNPFQHPPGERADWKKNLALPVKELAQARAAGETVDYLFFVGCMGSFVPRNRKVTLALTRILQEAGLSFAILGNEETCTGDPARRLGHEYLADDLAAKLVSKMNSYDVKNVVTACPHCFNAIRNEYPRLGGNYRVIHHSQLIAELIAAGRIKPGDATAPQSVTYHDPCYLGRYNQVFDEPRDVLAAATGNAPIEMRRNREHSFCCGGGGGHALMKDESSTRINVERVREAIRTRANVVAASCPFCMGMLEDGIGQVEDEHKPRILDIAELVEGSLSRSVPRATAGEATIAGSGSLETR